MTPRERWLALLARKTPDRIPSDYQATDEVTARLRLDLGFADDESLYRKLDIDARRMVEPVWNRPPDGDSQGAEGTVPICAEHPPGRSAANGTCPRSSPQTDMWGIGYRSVSYGSGVYLEPQVLPLAGARSVAEIHAHRWPSCEEFDYAVVARAVEQDDGYRPLHSGCYEPFLLYGYLRGLQTSLEDLALRPEMADAILGHIFDFYQEHHRRIFAAGRGKIDTTYVAEDLGRRPAR